MSGHSMTALRKACLFMLVAVAVADDATCAASSPGCPSKMQADANTLLQKGVRIGDELAPGRTDEKEKNTHTDQASETCRNLAGAWTFTPGNGRVVFSQSGCSGHPTTLFGFTYIVSGQSSVTLSDGITGAIYESDNVVTIHFSHGFTFTKQATTTVEPTTQAPTTAEPTTSLEALTTIDASPATPAIPAGETKVPVTISWSSNQKVQVWVVTIGAGTPEKLMACGESGSKTVNWIQAKTYRFTAYPASDCTASGRTSLTALATADVEGKQEASETCRNLAGAWTFTPGNGRVVFSQSGCSGHPTTLFGFTYIVSGQSSVTLSDGITGAIYESDNVVTIHFSHGFTFTKQA